MLVPMAYDKMSIAAVRSLRDSAVLGTAISAGATVAIIVAETQAARWRDDGTDPTTATGMLISTSTPPFVYDGSLENIRFINAVAGGILHVSLYKLG